MSASPRPDVHLLLELFDTLHKEYVSGEPAVIAGGRDGKILKELLKARDRETLGELMRLYYRTADAYVLRRGFSIPGFKVQMPALVRRFATRRRAAKSSPPDPYWTPIREAIEALTTRHDFSTWFGDDLRPARVNPPELTLIAPDQDTIRWIGKHFSDVVRAALQSGGGAIWTLRFESADLPSGYVCLVITREREDQDKRCAKPVEKGT